MSIIQSTSIIAAHPKTGAAIKQHRLNVKPRATDEFGKLKVVAVCSPKALWWDPNDKETLINGWEAENPPPITAKTLEEHKRMVDVMRSHGVEVVEIGPVDGLVESTYTRDWGVAIDKKFYKSRMFKNVRKPEPDQIAVPGEVRFEENEYLEGGDVLLPRKDMLFVGYGPRTSMAAVQRLKKEVGREVISFQIDPSEMHLDCGLAVFPGGHALMYPGAFADPQGSLEQVKKLFPHVEILDKEAYKGMGTNVQFLDEETMFTGNSQISKILRKWKFNPIYQTFFELHKGGGSYRCCTLPLVREESGIYTIY
ncbi:MAG: arginine deiminase family protein [Candidatus Micrarchaeia archaeon]